MERFASSPQLLTWFFHFDWQLGNEAEAAPFTSDLLKDRAGVPVTEQNSKFWLIQYQATIHFLTPAQAYEAARTTFSSTQKRLLLRAARAHFVRNTLISRIGNYVGSFNFTSKVSEFRTCGTCQARSSAKNPHGNVRP
jgi:hypothetical protein